ncbi:MAG: carboxymuconolactone decarboxylase family protein [Acidimicrobiales bacterium]|nr:carboxymuconolactone decarboxylase family protein [Acidimicrobiales bacterium]
MARIPFPNPEDLDPKTKELYDIMPVKLNLALMLGHSSSLARPFLKLGSSILLFSKLAPTLRELAILRVASLTGSHYELHHHIPIARSTGLSESSIGAALNIDKALDPDLSPKEALTLRLADEIVKQTSASEALVAECASEFGEETLVELVVSIGYYMMVSRFLLTFDVDLDKSEFVP